MDIRVIWKAASTAGGRQESIGVAPAPAHPVGRASFSLRYRRWLRRASVVFARCMRNSCRTPDLIQYICHATMARVYQIKRLGMGGG